MRQHARLLLLVAAIVTLVAAPREAAAVLYGATGTGSGVGTLGTIDPATGAFTPIGPIVSLDQQSFRVTGLAVDVTSNILYGSTGNQSPSAPGSLIVIDPTTAIATVVGSFGFSGQTMADITFLPDGTLVGWLEANADDLHTIDLATGAATLVGDSGLSTFGSGLAADASGTVFYAGSGTGGELRTIDTSTGAPTTVATLSDGPLGTDTPINSMAFGPDGTLFAVTFEFRGSAAHLVTIDTGTGAITDVGRTIDRLDAIAFDESPGERVPEPSTLLLLGTAGAALCALCRRRPRV